MRAIHHLLRRLLWAALLLLCSGQAGYAAVSATVFSTTSLCYDDGTLTVTPSGGTAPYTLILVSGPADPNITYPVTLAAGLTTFGGLPAGSYSITITDAGGATGTATGSVPGTYQFPTLAFAVHSGTIVGTITGGRAPYAYAISSTGSNTGFSAYQPADSFTGLCPGFYWVRVIDSCGNIYTNEVTYTDPIAASIACLNYSKGSLSVTASGGRPPYTYSIAGQSNSTGQFTGLPAYYTDTLHITDACGQHYDQYIPPPTVSLTQHCPSDSIIYLSGIAPPAVPDTLTFICTNCLPGPQTVTRVYDGTPIAADSLFLHQPQSTGYDIVVLSSACGGDTIRHAPPGISTDITLDIRFLSCKSFKASVSNHGAAVAVDSFVLTHVLYGPTVAANTTGLFENMPDGFYIVTAFIGPLCNDTPRAYVTIPYFSAGCFTLMKDASCHNAWEYSTTITTPETYSIIYPPHDTIAGDSTRFFNANFYHLATNTSYPLISDSGCRTTLTAPPADPPAVLASAYLPCVGQPVITFHSTPYTYCYGAAQASMIRIKVYYQGTKLYDIYASTDTDITANIVGSGTYHYQIYAVNPLDSSAQMRYDSICPIDTGSVFMANTQVPYLLSSVALVCDSVVSADSVTYQVYGGSIPYTVEIPGFDTVHLAGNTGIFPTRAAGTYTMIVYDNCGISRSLTFNIIDTCNDCPYAAIDLPDTFACAADTVLLRSGGVHGTVFHWYLNGTLYSQSRDTILRSGAGSNALMLVVTSPSGCADTAYAHTTDTCRGCPHPAISLSDTITCPGTTVTFHNASIGGVSYQWYVNGTAYSTAADTTYIPTATGTYTVKLLVTSATLCVDSATRTFTVLPVYSITLPPDTVYCGPFARVLSTGIPMTTWSTGQTGAQVTVTTPGTYTATATNLCGTATDAISISEKPLPVISLGRDTMLCAGGTVTLDAGNAGATYHWQDQSTGQTLTTTTTGTYTVTVTVNGCSAADAVNVKFIRQPTAFSLGPDTTICSIFPLVLNVYQPDAYYHWNTGSISPILHIDSAGTYIVTDSNACGQASDTIIVGVEICQCIVLIPTAFSPNGDGINDKYGAVSPCTPLDFSLLIYNRWGEQVFSSDNITDWWDGTFKGQPQPLSVFVWYMRYIDPYTMQHHSEAGNVTLVR